VTEAFFNTVGPDEQTVLVNFPAGLGTFATIVIFADSGVGNFALGTYWFDDITVVADPAATCTDGIQNGTETGVDCGGTCPNACPLPPTTIVAAPARPSLDVLSVFGPAYLDVPPSGVQQFAGATFVNYTAVTTDDARELTTPTPGGGAQYQYFFGTDTGLDLTNFTTVHLDSWVLDAGAADSVIKIILQNFDTTTGAFQHNLEATIDVNTPGVETWNTVDIELADFSNPTLARNNIQQIQIVAQGAAFGPTYLTNFYFHKGTVLGADDFSINDLKVSPNPSNDVWNIESSNISIDTIEIYDLLGKRVLNLSPNSQQVTIDASNLGTGIYLAKLYSNGATKTIKLVKN
ncbi:T9SS type A sorting domain-containing protein, partial [Winogradskyella sp.]